MKKLYTEFPYIKFNKLKSKKIMQRLSKHKKINNGNNKQKPHKLQSFFAPTIFSIKDNPEETIQYFSRISDAIHSKIPIKLSLKNVKEITPDAILYMLVLIKSANNKNIFISGSAPEVDSNAFELFTKSGFYNFVRSNSNFITDNDENLIFTIKTSNDVMPNYASMLLDFVKEKQMNLSPEDEAAIYETIIECMSNTNEHAADGKIGEISWWAMAIYDKTNKSIHFAMVDDGIGIARTVIKKSTEKFNNDAESLVLAISGTKSRSRTGYPTRNQGLPCIKSYQDRGIISHLVLVANNGYYNVYTNQPKKMKSFLHGSVISWDFESERKR